MQVLEGGCKQQVIRLYRGEAKDKGEEESQNIITLDLRNWRLLTHGGAYWIFHHHPQTSLPNQPPTTINYQHPNHQLIFRTRQLKYLIPLARIHSRFILSLEDASDDQIIRRELEEQQKRIGEMLGERRGGDAVRGIIDEVYERFLHACALSEQPTLAHISTYIVRQSPPYHLHNPHHLSLFITFLLKQLIYQQISSTTTTITCQKETFNKIEKHLAKHPVDVDRVIWPLMTASNNTCCSRGQQLVVTFERNLLHFHYQQTESSYQDLKIAQAFEFKPKTILPDIYTQTFLQQFVDRYQQKMQSQEQGSDNLSRTKMKQMIVREIQETMGNKGEVNMCSTRWFKKSCLVNGKKKMNNENPLVYFGGCLTNNQHINHNQAIDYYTKKHLRKLQLLDVNKTQQQKSQTNNHNNQPHQMEHSPHDKIIQLLISQKAEKGNKLSLIEEISALQLIDVIGLIRGDEERYMDAMRLGWRVKELKMMVGRSGVVMGEEGVVKERGYPTTAMDSIAKMFRSEVYSKAYQLSGLLRQIIFESEQVDKQITQAFFINHHEAKQSTQSAKTQIKAQIFYLTRFLISLTWKDISILVQQILSIISPYSQLHFNPKHPSSLDKHLLKQLLLESQSRNIDVERKIVGCGIIDYGIKTIENIERNVEKDFEFLENYLCYKRGLGKCKEDK